MRGDITKAALLCLAASAAASPLVRRSYNNNLTDEFEDTDDFPNPSAKQLLGTEKNAHGTLSNSTPPASVNQDTIRSLQVIAHQEQFEAAFFKQLLSNVTNDVTGFYIDDGPSKESTVKALTAIVAVCIRLYFILGVVLNDRLLARGTTCSGCNDRPQTFRRDPRRAVFV